MKIYNVRKFNKTDDGTLEMVEISYSVWGKEYTEVFDSKVIDGKNYIIDGNGWIKEGTEV